MHTKHFSSLTVSSDKAHEILLHDFWELHRRCVDFYYALWVIQHICYFLFIKCPVISHKCMMISHGSDVEMFSSNECCVCVVKKYEWCCLFMLSLYIKVLFFFSIVKITLCVSRLCIYLRREMDLFMKISVYWITYMQRVQQNSISAICDPSFVRTSTKPTH